MQFPSTSIFKLLSRTKSIPFNTSWSRYEFSNCSHTWTLPRGHDTGIQIYNPAAKKKAPLITKSSKYLTWYVCGPTVYDSTHLGHICTYIKFDIIRRILEKYANRSVIQVMNITDIDDKIIAKSEETNTNYQIIAKTYETEFFNDLMLMGVDKPTIVARVTDFIPKIINFINALLRKNIAYVGIDGSVYFSISKYGKHGKLQNLSDDPYSRCQNSNKIHYSDFVLWKLKSDLPVWESPWGLGRPGWHTECSVIASEYFGNNVDLHTGGIDLKFPHHENEESQCCVFHDVDQWVSYFLHTGHLTYSNEKMSKSLKNTVGVKEYLEDNSSNSLRMLCLNCNYRSNIQYDENEIGKNTELCSRFFQFFDNCRAYFLTSCNHGNIDSNHLLKKLEETRTNIDRFLVDDFDTASAILALHELVIFTNSMLNKKSGNRCITSISLVYNFVSEMMVFFGMNFTHRSMGNVQNAPSEFLLEDVITSSVNFRSQVRNLTLNLQGQQNQDLKKNLLLYCDDFREQLHFNGISLKDRRNDFSTWSYVMARATKSTKIKNTISWKRRNETSKEKHELPTLKS